MSDASAEDQTHIEPTQHGTVTMARRLFSASLTAGFCALFGFLVGRVGDSQNRNMAQGSLAVLGGAFGFLMSMFASKGRDTRSYDAAPSAHHGTTLHDKMDQKMAQERPYVIAGKSAMREGRLDEIEAPEKTR